MFHYVNVLWRELLDFVNQNYGDKIKVLTYAASLLYTFLNAANDLDLKCYDDFPMFEGWQTKEWVNVLGILDQAKRSLRLKGDSVNNGTMLRILNEWSHFDELKNEINQFAKKEKEKTLCGIFKLILSDYSGFIRKLEEDKDTIDGEMTAINSKIDAVNVAALSKQLVDVFLYKIIGAFVMSFKVLNERYP